MYKKIFLALGFSGLIALIILAWRVQPSQDEVIPKKAADTAPPKRIVSLAPSITEVLFELGLDEEIVGVTSYCNYPEAALAKPKVGDFITGDVEKIIVINPDLVITTRDGNPERTISLLEDVGIRVASYQPSTLNEVLDQIMVLGKEVGREGKARAIVGGCRSKAAFVRERVRDADEVSVLFVFGQAPLILAGRGTFSDDMIKICKGKNIAGDSRIPYPQFSLEEVIARAPDVIIDVSMGSDVAAQKAVERYWSRWPELPAVKNNRIYVLDQDLLARPGHRLFEGLVLLARSLHPERFMEESSN